MSAIRDCILIAGDEMAGTSRNGIDMDASDELDAMERRLAALETFARNFSEVVTDDLAKEEAWHRGGMRPATLTGDFVRLPPSAKGRLRWWAERAREALKEGK